MADPLALFDVLDSELMDSMRVLSETAAEFPEAISFSSGAPYDADYAFDDLTRLVDEYVSAADGPAERARLRRRLFHYTNVAGFIGSEIADYLRTYEDIVVDPRAIVVTNGFQEALLLTLRALKTSDRDVLLIAEPVYVGVPGAAAMLDLPVVGVRQGPSGVTAAGVAEAAAYVAASGRRVVGLYVNPDNNNPTGSTVPLAEREAILRVAGAHGFPVLEDNPYRMFSPEGAAVPSFRLLDRDGSVIVLGSFAKSVFPGARVGFVVGEQVTASGVSLAAKVSAVKSMVSVGTSSVSQAIVAAAISSPSYDLAGRIERARHGYLTRRDATVAALEHHFPAEESTRHGVTWSRPHGGFFIVLDTPHQLGLPEMRRSAGEFGVSWAPMRLFYTGEGGETSARLGFSNLDPQAIDAGIERLARFHAALSAEREAVHA